MKPYDLSVVMPVYNEAEAIGPVLKKWMAMLDTLGIRYRIRAYNDGSKDATGKILAEVADASDGRVLAVDKANSGHGPTILRGYREAAEDADWVFQIDSDDEMGPESFPELWSKRNDYDFLVGRRDGRRQPLARKVVSFVSRLSVRLFYGKGIWDVNTPYRLMRAEVFAPFYAQIPDDTFAPNVILSGLAARHRLRLLEIPVPQHDRTTGEVSIKKWKLLKAAARSFAQTINFSMDGFGILVTLAYVAVVVGLLTWLALSVIINDEAYNLHIVQLMDKGIFPLVDVHCMYTQLTYWALFPLKMLLGSGFGLLTIQVIAVALVGLSAHLAWRLARYFECSRTVSHGVSLTMLVMAFAFYNFFAPWCLFFGTSALALYFLRRSVWRLFACGVLLALSYLSKQNALVWVGVLVWAILFFESGSYRKIRGGFLAFLGFSLTVGCYILFLRWMNGSWIGSTTLLGDPSYEHGLGNLMAVFRSVLLPLVTLCVLTVVVVPFAEKVWQRRLIFLTLCALTVLSVFVVSPYPHNLVSVISIWALYLGVTLAAAKKVRHEGAVLLLWGGFLTSVIMLFVEALILLLGGTIFIRGGHVHRYHEVTACLSAYNETATERLFVFPDGSEPYYSLYTDSDLIPANLVVRHNDNLFWGTEKLGRDDDIIRDSLNHATLILVKQSSEATFRAFWPKATTLSPIETVQGFTLYRHPPKTRQGEI